MTSEEQAVSFLAAVLLGGGLGAVFDGYRILGSLRRFGRQFSAAGDILFWLFAAAFSLVVLGMATDGQLRGYFFLGMLLGGVLYFKWLSRTMQKVWLLLVRFVRRLVRFTHLLLSWLLVPIRLLGRLFVRLGRWGKRFWRKKTPPEKN